MNKTVFVGSQAVTVDTSRPIGEGGEAYIFAHGKDEVMKLYREPSDPLYAGADAESKRNRAGAKHRLEVQQQKLPLFPKGLPNKVIAPSDLVRVSTRGQIIGYTMPFVKGAELLRQYSLADWRMKNRVSGNEVVEIFRDLHSTVKQTHGASVVIGDFNNLNVMVRGSEAYVIDADSMQWGIFPSETFTPRYVDPLICDPTASALMMAKRHNQNSDWYAFAVMLWEALLLVHPYGGVYRPKDPKKRVSPNARPLHRISVLHPEVQTPDFGIPPQLLPDEVLSFYEGLLHKDKRGEFPNALLQNLRWTKCQSCGVIHARVHCPKCAKPVPKAALKAVIRAGVSAERVAFHPKGLILRAALQNGKLLYLYHEDGVFRRESGESVLEMDLVRDMRFRLSGQKTIISSQGRTFALEFGKGPERIHADQFRGRNHIFDANGQHLVWLQGGQLMRSDARVPRNLGTVLEGQTLLWVGNTFGVTLYKVGGLQRLCVFDPNRTGQVTVNVPPIHGEILEVKCFFTDERCWLLLAVNRQGSIYHHALLISRDGTLKATAEALEGDDSWLGQPIRTGKCGAQLGSNGNVEALLVATDSDLKGIVEEQGQLVEKFSFPAAHDFVSPSSELLYQPGKGLFVVGQNEITLVKTTK